jgi:hypothetical protein
MSLATTISVGVQYRKIPFKNDLTGGRALPKPVRDNQQREPKDCQGGRLDNGRS